MLEIFIFLFIWMLLDNILLIFSKHWRKYKIESLIKYDNEMKDYWKIFVKDLKKLFRKKTK